MYISQPALPPVRALTEAAVPITAADFLADILPTWTDLGTSRARDLHSAIATVCRICGLPSEAVPLSCGTLNPLLFAKPAAAFGLSRKRFQNVVSELRYVLQRLGLHAPRQRGRGGLSPAWQALYDGLRDRHRQAALVGFMGYCTRHDIAPDQVRPDAVAAFERWCTEAVLTRDPRSRALSAALEWNRARGQVAGWPTVELRLAPKRVAYTLPITAYPEAFQADLERFARRLACDDLEDLYTASGGLLEPRGGTTRLGARPGTVRTQVFRIRQAAAALVARGRAPETITSLRDLVQPHAAVRSILSFFLDRAGRKPTTQTGGIAELLRQIARYHCELPEAEIEAITKLARRVSPARRGGMIEKNRHRLRALMEERNRAMLLHLPGELVRRAEDADDPPHSPATLVMRAVALEILLVCPMRLSNLQRLRLGRHLCRLDPRIARITHLFVSGDEVKNEVGIEWPIPKESAQLIERYIAKYRPLLAPGENPHLFPGRDGAPLSINALRAGIERPIQTIIGVKVNPHLLRHFAAWRYLREHPGEYETVRRILGHKSAETTIAFYTGLEAAYAAEHLNALLFKDRGSTKATAAGAFRRARHLAQRRR